MRPLAQHEAGIQVFVVKIARWVLFHMMMCTVGASFGQCGPHSEQARKSQQQATGRPGLAKRPRALKSSVHLANLHKKLAGPKRAPLEEAIAPVYAPRRHKEGNGRPRGVF